MEQKRSTLLKINPIFTAHLINYQDSKYNPRTSLFEEGQKVFLKYGEKIVHLTREQAEILNQKDIASFNANKDTNPFGTDVIYPIVSEKALVSGKKNTKVFLLNLGETLEALRKKLKQQQLIILSDWPLLDSAVLRELTEISDKEITERIPQLFWLTRRNATLPDFMMTFDSSKTVMSLCKYGVLHLDFYDKKEEEFILKFFASRGFEEVEYCKDFIDFDE